jgi:class 3 adenylate cyclase
LFYLLCSCCNSVREPTQVFKLLETLYQSFDTIAKKRKVFKVETIGDCYVAVTGLPEAQPGKWAQEKLFLE